MAEKFGFDYDYKYDSLFIHSIRRKSSESVDLGEIFIDLDKNGNVSGIEIIPASKCVSELAGRKITRQSLKKMSGASLTSTPKKGITIIRIVLGIEKQDVPAVMAIQNPKYKSPAMAYA